MSGNFFREIAIAFGILFTDNSKALIVYSPRTHSSVVVRRSNQRNPQTFRSRRGQPRNLADVKFDQTQIKKKFKHAPDFNIEGSPSSDQIASYQDKLQQHIDSEKTVKIEGTYRKVPVVHYLDPESKANVVVDTNGRFVSAWKLSDAQFENVKSRGSL
tara:strand:- start:157 stop:630 length:474 start_codon:yes stop_codon:yes gene_type:complete